MNQFMTRTGRRGFFKHSLDELIAVFDESRGRPSFKLTDLAGLSDEQLGRLIPAIMDASRVRAYQGNFVIKHPDGHTDVLFGINSLEEDVWSRIDGQSNLEEIADSIAISWNETGEAAFERTRKVFLQLADRQICIPLNPLEP